MVGIKLYDDKRIDTSSKELREKVSKAVADYIVENWDEVVKVQITEDIFNDDYEAEFKISL